MPRQKGYQIPRARDAKEHQADWFLSDAFAVTLPGPLVDTKWLAENL
jgi:hypothetical protein